MGYQDPQVCLLSTSISEKQNTYLGKSKLPRLAAGIHQIEKYNSWWDSCRCRLPPCMEGPECLAFAVVIESSKIGLKRHFRHHSVGSERLLRVLEHMGAR